MELAELKERFVGVEFDTAQFEVVAEEALGFAEACGETDPRFTDPAHPDFQAPPTYTARFHGTRAMPEGFPQAALARTFDGGKCVTVHAPLRVGSKLVARSRIADIFEKTGRSGTMTFIVHRMEFHTEDGTHVSTVDWKLIQRGEA